MIDGRSLPSAVALEDVLRRGREALAAGQIDGAIRTFNDALRIKPTYAPAWRGKARALRAAGNADGALACYAEALRNDPDDEASWFGLAMALHELGKRQDEVLAYDELLRRNSRNVAAWMNKGVAAHEARHFEDALACCDRILAMRPEIAAAWNNRGAALLRLRRYEEALAAFDEALMLDGSFADALGNRTTALARLGRDEAVPQAATRPEKATVPRALMPRVLAGLRLAPIEVWRQSPPMVAEDFVALGLSLVDEGKPQAAVSAFAKGAALGAGAVAAVGKLGAMDITGDPRSADESAELLAAHPGDVRTAIAVARSRETRGDRAGARSALESVVADRPDLAWIWNWKGLLELDGGDAAEARMSFEGATASDPDDPEAWANLAAALYLDGDAEGALAACERALALDPTFGAAENNRGVILASLGRHREAEAAFRKAGKTLEGDVVALNRAALAESVGRFREAQSLYTHVLERSPKLSEAISGRRRVQGRIGARARKRTARKRTAGKVKRGRTRSRRR